MSSTVHIIGAGMAGLAAALSLSESGRRVVLYEAAPAAGGRCRSFYDKKLKTTVDNGNHLVLGANRSVIDYLTRLGTLEACISHPMPRFSFIDIHNRQHWHFQPPAFKGIPWQEWRFLLRLFNPPAEKTVAECIPENSKLYHRLIEPLTLSALNTHPHEASARILSHILRLLIIGGRRAWRHYVPAHPLSAIFVDPTLAKIKGRGGSIRLQTPVHRLEETEGRISALGIASETIRVQEGESVICALPPYALAQLLPEYAPAFTYNAIVNAHFLWPQAGMFRENMPFLGVLGAHVQWIFFHEGRLSTTTSAANGLMETDEEELAALLWSEVCRALFIPQAKLPPYRIIKEKRATFAATPENAAKRPSMRTRFTNLILAGDYVDSSYPATLETAINSGNAAAAIING